MTTRASIQSHRGSTPTQMATRDQEQWQRVRSAICLHSCVYLHLCFICSLMTGWCVTVTSYLWRQGELFSMSSSSVLLRSLADCYSCQLRTRNWLLSMAWRWITSRTFSGCTGESLSFLPFLACPCLLRSSLAFVLYLFTLFLFNLYMTSGKNADALRNGHEVVFSAPPDGEIELTSPRDASKWYAPVPREDRVHVPREEE